MSGRWLKSGAAVGVGGMGVGVIVGVDDETACPREGMRAVSVTASTAVDEAGIVGVNVSTG